MNVWDTTASLGGIDVGRVLCLLYESIATDRCSVCQLERKSAHGSSLWVSLDGM